MDKLSLQPAARAGDTQAAPAYDPFALETIAKAIEGWLAWSHGSRAAEGLPTDGDTHIMALPVPHWPTHGALDNWVKALRGQKTGFGELAPPATVEVAALKHRIDELLEANSRYLQRARDAEAALARMRRFSPEILAAHAEFGGDLEDMQHRYDGDAS